jgi:hypothetical protein
VPYQLGLLFQSVSVERAAIDQLIRVSAKWVTHHHQIEAAARLGLPDMGHLMNEQALERKALLGEIL